MQVVTLSSDIGHHDYLVGAIKGQLLFNNNNLNIIDITHYLTPSNFPQSAYVCKNAFLHYPPKSIHIILLSIFENSATQFLVAFWKEQIIICPDNGILSLIAHQIELKNVRSININNNKSFLSITKKIAETVNTLSKEYDIFSIENSVEKIVEKLPLQATYGTDWIDGQILFIDHFENVVVNITKQEFDEQRKGRKFKIIFKRNEVIDIIHNNYSDVQEGEKVAFFNSAGYLEIAINKGNMAGLFGLQGFNAKMHQQNIASQNKWFYQTVRIFFE